MYSLRFTLFCFSLVGSFMLLSQEIPPIQNFGPSDYDGEYQNWAISQAGSKKIYVANHTSLLEYDGVRWRKYRLPNATIIRSVKVQGGKVFIGCYGEFGFWSPNASGILQYTSISKKFKNQLLDDEEFWDILIGKNTVLFQSLDRIYIYDLLEDSLKSIKAKTEKAKLFLIKDKVYFQKKNKGLFTIDNGKAVAVNEDGELSNELVVNAYKKDNGLLLVTYSGRFLFLADDKLSVWETDIQGMGLKLYSCQKLSDGSFALGTISDGFYHLSSKGEFIRKINQSNGLKNNTVLSLFEDVDNNLWLGLDNGLSVLNMDSPFNEFTDPFGNLGLVYGALDYNGYLYLGTNQGLFYKKNDTTDKFKLIVGTEGQVWSLQLIEETVFCGHNSGTFIVDGENAELIAKFPGTWTVKPIAQNSNLAIQGNYNGLAILEKKLNRWSLKNIIDGFDMSSRFFEVDSLNIIINHENKGLYYLQVDPNMERVTKTTNLSRLGHSSNIFNYKDKVYYKTHNGIYNLEFDSTRTKTDSTLSKLVFQKNSSPISRIIPDSTENKLWYFTDSSINYISPHKITGKPTVSSIGAPKKFMNNLGVAGFENISKVKNHTYLIGISNGYVTLDLEKVTTKSYNVTIDGVFNGDYENYRNISLKEDVEFASLDNNLRFEYSVREYSKYVEVLYQYKLEGLYDDWSDWDTNPEVTFNNLPFGQYQFQLRAKIGNQASNNISYYGFEILRPWYLSNLAIVLYGLALFLVLFLIHRSYKGYYRKKQELLVKENQKLLEKNKLEERERIAQLKNEKLRNEIDNKNRELAISTMSILKKNRFLNSIKSQLNTISSKERIVKSVVEEIDRNINSKDDWKFFEDAFNNADKDFLKRMMAKHESLTHNDLRLCAYLRLNLSSKEIAPLLNISIKSVEMKRYRLRKKINLPHQDNLIDYILNF